MTNQYSMRTSNHIYTDILPDFRNIITPIQTNLSNAAFRYINGSIYGIDFAEPAITKCPCCNHQSLANHCTNFTRLMKNVLEWPDSRAHELLLDKETLDAQDTNGHSALIMAVKLCKVRMCAKLLAAGTNVNLSDNNKDGALFHAIGACTRFTFVTQTKLIDLLIKYDANILLALHYALVTHSSINVPLVMHLLQIPAIRQHVQTLYCSTCLVTVLTHTSILTNDRYELTAEMCAAGAQLTCNDLSTIVSRGIDSGSSFEIFKLLVRHTPTAFTPMVLEACIFKEQFNAAMLVINCVPLQHTDTPTRLMKSIKLLH